MSLPTESDHESLARSSSRTALTTALSALLVVGAIVYSSFRLYQVGAEVNRKNEQLKILDRDKAEVAKEVARLRTEASEKSKQVDLLTSTQGDILEFLGRVTEKENIRLIGEDVDWPRTNKGIQELPPGRRKQAVLGAILLAWHSIPFALGQHSAAKGFDSPRFIQFLLGRVGIQVTNTPNERLSAAMMRTFARVDSPQPGDLMIYKGNVGNFVMMYLGPGSNRGNGVCIGTFESGQPVQVMDSVNFRTSIYPFISYYRVPY